jgi:hypothetical protein
MRAMARYDAACAALAAASKVDEAKSIRDKAEAMRVYARQAQNLELEQQAIKIRLRAERRTGELLKEAKENGTREKRGGDRKSKSQNGTLIPKLTDLCITKKQSADWQKMADIPPADFESRLASAAESGANASTQAILRGPVAKVPVVPEQETETPGVAEEAAKEIVAGVMAYRNHLEDAEWRETLGLVIAALQREQRSA